MKKNKNSVKKKWLIALSIAIAGLIVGMILLNVKLVIVGVDPAVHEFGMLADTTPAATKNTVKIFDWADKDKPECKTLVVKLVGTKLLEITSYEAGGDMKSTAYYSFGLGIGSWINPQYDYFLSGLDMLPYMSEENDLGYYSTLTWLQAIPYSPALNTTYYITIFAVDEKGTTLSVVNAFKFEVQPLPPIPTTNPTTNVMKVVLNSVFGVTLAGLLLAVIIIANKKKMKPLVRKK